MWLKTTARIGVTIAHNDVHASQVGVAYDTAAVVSGNRIFDNGVGVTVTVTVNSETDGFGFVVGSSSNDIFHNTVGIDNSGRVQNQRIFGNAQGVTGSGRLGPVWGDVDRANLIYNNDVGVASTGDVLGNRIYDNAIGIQLSAGQTVGYNLIYGNTDVGVLAHGPIAPAAAIVHNTFYSAQGTNIRLEGGAVEVEVRNNILWTHDGYNVSVANDAQTGYFGDHNLLHATGDGKLYYWTKDFRDLLDLQADVARFELHSPGTTVINPNGSAPRFVDRGRR